MIIKQEQRPTLPTGAPATVSDALGQITWVLTQSPLHRELELKDLEWAVMPAILSEQFRIFRFGPLPIAGGAVLATLEAFGLKMQGLEQLPLGVALWASLSHEAEQKIERGERLAPGEWASGDRLWLVELISPYATPENRMAEVMLYDLMGGPFKGRDFWLHRTDPVTGRRDKIKLHGHSAAGATPQA